MLNILQVEDDPDDIFLFQRALRHAPIRCSVASVMNGEQAMQYLLGEGEYGDRTRFPDPDLILLDLKLPRKDGFEVLQWIKKDLRLKLIPVVVFSSSSQLSDIYRAYELGANSYIVKTSDFDKMEDQVKVLLTYWSHFSECASLPPI